MKLSDKANWDEIGVAVGPNHLPSFSALLPFPKRGELKFLPPREEVRKDLGRGKGQCESGRHPLLWKQGSSYSPVLKSRFPTFN